MNAEIEAEAIDPYSLKHQPVYLLAYEAHDGPYADDSDCKYLSLGWAQYDQRSASLKTLRHTGTKWSRQSEEIPLHRAVDLVFLLAQAIRRTEQGHLKPITFSAGALENQAGDISIKVDTTSSAEEAAFSSQITNELVQRRLNKLREVLNELHAAGKI